MNVLCALVLATTMTSIEASTAITVTGPITGTPVFLEWTPGPAPIADAHPLPLPDIGGDVGIWLGIAWYWIKTTWLDNRIFGYWLIYQFAVAVLGNLVGQILTRGGFFRLLQRNMPPPDREPEVITRYRYVGPEGGGKDDGWKTAWEEVKEDEK